MTLPKDDQPDTYTGIWNRVKITHVVPDSHQGVYHLIMPGDKVRTYCTVTNPLWACAPIGPRPLARTSRAGQISGGYTAGPYWHPALTA